MELVFMKLYPLVALLSLSGYIPQIIKLARATSPKDGISLQSWMTWILNNGISLGYGIFHLHDGLFIITVCSSLASQIALIGMVVWNRYFRFRHHGVICVTSLRAKGAI